MAELSLQDRPQPALLDRLADNEPEKKTEARENRIISKTKLRQSVLRDLAWLLNTVNLSSSIDFTGLSYAERSVINFGVPALFGQIASTLEVTQFENNIKQAIINFEPRIVPETLQVKAIISDLQLDHHNLISIQISGDLWAQPSPIELLLSTEIDLETGQIGVRDLVSPGMSQERR